jgi:cytoskeletal protein CcmA (bactofilin family)
MAISKTNPGTEINVTVIGDAVRVQGTLSGDEDLHVLGRVDGRIELNRTLVVAPTGIVKAEVMVKNAVVSGVVVGNIHASESVEITREGRMVGDVYSPRVIIVDGACFRGSIDMGDTASMAGRQSGNERSSSAPSTRPLSSSSSPTPSRFSSPLSAPPPPARSSAPSSPWVNSAPVSTPVVAPVVVAAVEEQQSDDVETLQEAEHEQEQELDQGRLPTDPPQARGLSQKSNKARVIVKRK